ncbi:MAG TPA: hypothetical protein VEW71_05060 [Allosphingosinicella sp.]|nr:hypothetical protein [Allosphingosinicella sp.]
MEILDYHIDLLTAAQVGATAAMVGIYAILTSIGEQRAINQSDRQMMLLISFVLQEHSSIKTLSDIVDRQQIDILGDRDNMEFFLESFESYQKDGTIPNHIQSSEIFDNLLAIIFSPAFSVIFLVLMRDWNKRKHYRVKTTILRKNYFSKAVMMAVAGVGYVFAAGAVINGIQWLAICLFILGLITILASALSVALLTFEQQSWKAYWGDRLAEILATQDMAKAHDQFNRALLLSNSIDEQPDVPFPGRLGLYTGIYSIVQVLILVVDSRLKG